MLKMKIEDWQSRIIRQFNAGLFSYVLIGFKKTKEITNFEYCLIPEKICNLINPPVPEEQIERDFVIKRSLDMYYDYLRKDLNTRQGAFVNNYDNKDNHCISYFHCYVRDKKFCMNIYVRSMDFIRNFEFDCQTFNLAYSSVFEQIKLQYGEEVDNGYIRVFVFSLHIYE